MNHVDVGLGDENFRLCVCIDKRPAFMQLHELNGMQALVDGEIAAIGQACGNGWRKVFNVYAKLVWALAHRVYAASPELCNAAAGSVTLLDEVSAQAKKAAPPANDVAYDAKEPLKHSLGPWLKDVLRFSSWQAYRDVLLLQPGSGTALQFSAPAFKRLSQEQGQPLTLVMGRGYGMLLAKEADLGIRLRWLSDHFAVDDGNRLLVCPYFDYRQLTDKRINELVSLMLAFYQ